MSEAIWRRGELQTANGRSIMATAGPVDTDESTELGEVLEAVQQTVVDLVQALPQHPSHVVVRSGYVEIDIDWRVAAPTPQLLGPAAAPPQALAPVPTSVADIPAGSPSPPAPAATSTPLLDYVCSPSVGTFYSALEPGAAPFVVEGAQVRRGQTVAIVEAMKLMLPVESEHSGRIVEILIADGQGVEFGERLIAVQKDA